MERRDREPLFSAWYFNRNSFGYEKGRDFAEVFEPSDHW